jgi:Chromo (CHRromatin Organisation MOdifier) domain
METILKHQRRGQSYWYLIKWEGYPITKASWQPEEAFSNDGDLLSLYKKRHQLWDILHLVKHSEEPERQRNWPFLPYQKKEYWTLRYYYSLKLLMTFLWSSTNLHMSSQIKTLSWKVLCKESKTEPPNISMTGLFTRKHCQQYASNFNQILLLLFFWLRTCSPLIH